MRISNWGLFFVLIMTIVLNTLLRPVGRYDGSYYFAQGNRFGFFPAVSLGWRLSKENFMKGISWIDNLKVRGSYGEVGALAGGAYQYLNAYGVYGNVVVLSGAAQTAVRQTSEANQNITWERARKTDIGFDATFLKGLLTVEADYFYELRSNMLQAPDAKVPYEYGISLAQVNEGKMENRGIDFTLGSNITVSKDFQISPLW